jgi:hypothetical protein
LPHYHLFRLFHPVPNLFPYLADDHVVTLLVPPHQLLLDPNQWRLDPAPLTIYHLLAQL